MALGFVLFNSLTLGLIVSALWWAIVDTFHHATGIRCPALNYAKLAEKMEPFVLVFEANYRFYQFYSNLFIAAVSRLQTIGIVPAWLWIGGIAIEGDFFPGSRDALRRYYERASAILGERASRGEGSSLEEFDD